MVVLSTADVPALSAFYRALGWPEQPGGTEALCRFHLGDLVLALYRNDETTGSAAAPSVGRPATTLVIKLQTAEEVDSAHAGALTVGARSVTGPADHSWGGRSAVVADPEGNRWELLWSPPPG